MTKFYPCEFHITKIVSRPIFGLNRDSQWIGFMSHFKPLIISQLDDLWSVGPIYEIFSGYFGLFLGVIPDHNGELQTRGHRVRGWSGAQNIREINPLGVSIKPEGVFAGDFFRYELKTRQKLEKSWKKPFLWFLTYFFQKQYLVSQKSPPDTISAELRPQMDCFCEYFDPLITS